MDFAEVLGYLASLLVFATFYMKTMVPLRVVALASNVVFVSYGVAEGLYPVIVLHATLLPLNLFRLVQFKRLVRKVEEAASGDLDIKVLLPHMNRKHLKQGDILFRNGDEADAMYYIAHGKIHLVEVDAVVGKGDVIGEIGMFSPNRDRTATAVCATPCEVHALSAARIHQYFYENPAFGFALMRLITARLLQNIQRSAN